MPTKDQIKFAEQVAHRMTDGGKEKIFVKDVAEKHRGWLDWRELAALISEEMADENVHTI